MALLFHLCKDSRLGVGPTLMQDDLIQRCLKTSAKTLFTKKVTLTGSRIRTYLFGATVHPTTETSPSGGPGGGIGKLPEEMGGRRSGSSTCRAGRPRTGCVGEPRRWPAGCRGPDMCCGRQWGRGVRFRGVSKGQTGVLSGPLRWQPGRRPAGSWWPSEGEGRLRPPFSW